MAHNPLLPAACPLFEKRGREGDNPRWSTHLLGAISLLAEQAQYTSAATGASRVMFGRSRVARELRTVRCLLAANHTCKQLATKGGRLKVHRGYLNSAEVSQLKFRDQMQMQVQVQVQKAS